MRIALTFEEFLNEQENKIALMAIKFLHEGVEMKYAFGTLNEGSVDKANYELNRMLSRAEAKGETPIVKEFVPLVRMIVVAQQPAAGTVVVSVRFAVTVSFVTEFVAYACASVSFARAV